MFLLMLYYLILTLKAEYNKDPILNVFLRVFNEMQGFCVESPFVADLKEILLRKNFFQNLKQNLKRLLEKIG